MQHIVLINSSPIVAMTMGVFIIVWLTFRDELSQVYGAYGNRLVILDCIPLLLFYV